MVETKRIHYIFGHRVCIVTALSDIKQILQLHIKMEHNWPEGGISECISVIQFSSILFYLILAFLRDLTGQPRPTIKVACTRKCNNNNNNNNNRERT